ncbi:16S rRNA (cytidine(1402)-2'-O)-methyltransferase [Desulfovibrio sp. OttesenSCG-928-G11]|nr:16S rRNA (cytidine(1402)-2'-O)-methyltransferase [Desulfovibrio sp. OttesenSCG-928-G11]
MSSKTGILWVTATPLGNPGDLSPRAASVLAAVDGVLAEDTRRAGRLFAVCGLSPPPFTSLHDHNEDERLDALLARLRAGEQLALVSDAGTPLLSDPGFRLVRACRKEGIAVSPLPGPFAAAAALSVCGLAPQPFVFLGFAPRKEAERRAFFLPFADLAATLVFYERKDRLRATLSVAGDLLGAREGCLAREMTKTHEEFIFFRLPDLLDLPEEPLGEITVIIGPPEQPSRSTEEEVDALLLEEGAAGGGAREAARRVMERASGWTRKEIYGRMQRGRGQKA